MTVKELKNCLSAYNENADVRVYIKCKNTIVGIDQVLPYNTDVMVCLNMEDEKLLFNITP